MSNK
jgi:hypothetical protein